MEGPRGRQLTSVGLPVRMYPAAGHRRYRRGTAPSHEVSLVCFATVRSHEETLHEHVTQDSDFSSRETVRTKHHLGGRTRHVL